MSEPLMRDEPPVAIFTALAWESAAVRSVLRHTRKEQERVWRGVAGNREVIVVTGGIGPRRTERTLEQFLQTPLSAVFSIGCAGALVPGLMTGQLVLAPDVSMHEMNEETHSNEIRLQRFPVDPRLLSYAKAAAAKVGIPTTEGSLFTSPKILFTPEEKAQRGRETGAVAVEMESGIHAAFAARRGLPFLVLRVILDGADVRLPVLKGLMTPDGDVRAFKAAMYVATHPHDLPALLTLKRCRAAAAQTLARTCSALFALLFSGERARA
jgi:adenosylhomocysteine nucleosidase